MNTLYIITGAPGAGKTTFGKKLAVEKHAIFLDIDSCTEPIVRASLKALNHDPDDRDSPFFKSIFRDPIYDTLFKTAKENLGHSNVVLTGPFTRERENQNWTSDLSTTLGAIVTVYYIHCPAEIRRQRLIERGNPRDRPKLDSWESFLTYYGDEKPPAHAHIFVDVSQ